MCTKECRVHILVSMLSIIKFYVGYLCDNIGLILACLPSGSTDVTASARRYITNPSGIPILSPVLFMRVDDPYNPPFKFEEYLFTYSSFNKQPQAIHYDRDICGHVIHSHNNQSRRTIH